MQWFPTCWENFMKGILGKVSVWSAIAYMPWGTGQLHSHQSLTKGLWMRFESCLCVISQLAGMTAYVPVSLRERTISSLQGSAAPKSTSHGTCEPQLSNVTVSLLWNNILLIGSWNRIQCALTQPSPSKTYWIKQQPSLSKTNTCFEIFYFMTKLSGSQGIICEQNAVGHMSGLTLRGLSLATDSDQATLTNFISDMRQFLVGLWLYHILLKIPSNSQILWKCLI